MKTYSDVGKSVELFPTIIEQGFPSVTVDNSLLTGPTGTGKFNGSIIRHDGKILMGYRHFDEKKGDTVLSVAELDENFQPVKTVVSKIIAHGLTGRFEDCRLFHHNGDLWMSFAELETHRLPTFRCFQRCIKLGPSLGQARDLQVRIGKNYGASSPPHDLNVEKNWMWFSHDGSLYCIYDLPTQHVYHINDSTGNVIEEFKKDPIIWGNGRLRGGSPPVEHNGRYIGFYHTGTDHEWLQRRYGMGVYELEMKPPFRLTRLSRAFVWGSSSEPFCGSGNGRCIFPAGQVRGEGGWHVSCGINDTYNAIIFISDEQIEKYLEPIDWFREDHSTYWSVHTSRPHMTVFGLETVGILVRTSGVSGPTYFYKTEDPVAISSLKESEYAIEIDKDTYDQRVNAILTKKMAPPPNFDAFTKKPKALDKGAGNGKQLASVK